MSKQHEHVHAPNGAFLPGTFSGGPRLAERTTWRGIGSIDVADALGVPHPHIERILEGSMPLPGAACASYRALAEMLDVLLEPVPLSTLHAWQREDANLRSALPGAPRVVHDDVNR